MRTAKRKQAGRGENALAADVRAYEQIRQSLEREHMEDFALFFAGEFIQTFPDFDSAAVFALRRFGKGPYLIQRIGSPTGIDADTLLHLSR